MPFLASLRRWKKFGQLPPTGRSSGTVGEDVCEESLVNTQSSPLTIVVTIPKDAQQSIQSSTHHVQSSTNIDLLPFDLLVAILKLAISVESEFSPKYNIKALRVVNAVNNHWRRTALSAPSLWSYIPPHLSPTLFQTFVHRSGNALLHTELAYGNIFKDASDTLVHASELDPPRLEDGFLLKLDTIIPHLNRIRYLSLMLSTSALMSSDIGSRLFNSRNVHCITPVLEGFRFVNTTDLNWCPSNEASVKRAELSTFTTFCSQHLSSLHFIGMTIPRSSIPTSKLTSLSLTLVNTIASTEQYLRDVLSNAPSLVSLSLDLWSIHDMSVDEGPSLDTILLPELRHLTMRGTCSICWRISRILSIPSINEICIKTGRSPLELANHFVPFSPRGGRLRIIVEKSKLQLEFVESVSFCGGEKTHFVFTILTGTEFHEGIRFCNKHVVDLLQTRRFSKVTAFEYSTSDNFDTTFMSKLLSHFTSLEELSLNFSCPMDWITFRIQNTIDLKLVHSPTPSPLQSLRKLVFQNFSVTFPQSVPFLVKLRSFTQGADGTGLPPLILEIKDREGVDDAILHAYYAAVGQDAANS